MLMFIRDSRRSYRTYSYAELILITDLCAFRTPVGVTELMLQSLTYSEVPVGTTKITERILVFRSTYLSYRTYTGLTELTLVYRTYSYLTDLILVLQNLLLYFGYRSTRRYYRTFTGTKVPVGTIEQIPYTEVLVGTTGLILTLSIKEYP